ncbi:hypothetical protein SAMN05661096_01256 [Marivirga sericea]|uniref:DUF7151 domain-containing protein n=2 Tax=Marivirga sericea TaxID=1028 RepID=A0A1X7J3K2_9BACT|nr:hypothetical protein SAMN05661096_01256 [Marivirga sericea]
MKKPYLLLVFLLVSLMSCEGPEGPIGPDGIDGQDGINGQDGADGQDGANSLTKLTVEPPGVNCVNGGYLHETGTDSNGNGILDTDEVTNSQYICNGENILDQVDYYFQEGWKGYEGTISIGISSDQPNFSNTYAICSIDTQDQDTARSLLKFTGLSTQIADDFGTNTVYLNEAILYVHTSCIGNNPNSLAVGTFDVFDSTIPSFDEDATWLKANLTDLWPSAGSFTDNSQSELTYGTFDDRFYFNGGISYLGSWIPLRLSRRAASQWIANEQNNKGIVISLELDQDGLICFDTHLEPIEEYRPILYLNVEENSSGGRIASKSELELAEEWNKKSFDEKLAPLHYFLQTR